MKKFLISTFLALCLGGCSSGFVYNNIDWLVHWYIDDYVDLSAKQKRLFDNHMQQWLQWHRSEELVAYRHHIQQLQGQVEKAPLTQQQWLNQFERGRTHWNRLLQALSGDLGILALKLSDRQVTSIFAELEQRNKDTEERRKERRGNWRVDKLQEDIVDWIGPISPAQEALVRRLHGQLKPNFDDWMRYRRKWQSAAKDVLLHRENTEQWHQALVDVLLQPRQFEHQNYKEQSRHNRNVYASLLEQLHASLSERQKAHLLDEIEDLIRDLNDLIGDT